MYIKLHFFLNSLSSKYAFSSAEEGEGWTAERLEMTEFSFESSVYKEFNVESSVCVPQRVETRRSSAFIVVEGGSERGTVEERGSLKVQECPKPDRRSTELRFIVTNKLMSAWLLLIF